MKLFVCSLISVVEPSVPGGPRFWSRSNWREVAEVGVCPRRLELRFVFRSASPLRQSVTPVRSASSLLKIPHVVYWRCYSFAHDALHTLPEAPKARCLEQGYLPSICENHNHQRSGRTFPHNSSALRMRTRRALKLDPDATAYISVRMATPFSSTGYQLHVFS